MSRTIISRKSAIFLTTLVLASLLSACTSLFGPQSNHGDEISERLALGMTHEEVEARLRDMTYLMLSKKTFELPWGYIYFGADTAAVPADLLLSLPEGAEQWSYGYWVSSNDIRGVDIFFSREGRVIGWTRTLSEMSRQRYAQEALTRRLAYEMTDAEVVALLGPPQAILPRPEHKKRTRELYADHYWSLDPTFGIRPEMWMYTYALPDGSERHVYLLWQRTLFGWGYDHAHLEAE